MDIPGKYDDVDDGDDNNVTPGVGWTSLVKMMMIADRLQERYEPSDAADVPADAADAANDATVSATWTNGGNDIARAWTNGGNDIARDGSSGNNGRQFF